MKRIRFEMDCRKADGKVHLTARTAPEVTDQFVRHVQPRIRSSFSVVYNAGQDGESRFDSCHVVLPSEAAATSLVASFRLE